MNAKFHWHYISVWSIAIIGTEKDTLVFYSNAKNIFNF